MRTTEGKYKICVYGICKNEEKFVNRWMDSVGDADMIVVTDTGSTDNTVKLLEERGATVHTYIPKMFRFDECRNYCMQFIPKDFDICISLDLDEILLPDWRNAIENAWRRETKLGRYMFNWKLAKDGTPEVQYYYDRIHARKDFEWIYPTHEILKYTGNDVYIETFIPGLTVNHYPEMTKSRSFNLPLLELAASENKTSRNMHYLGREYMYMGEWLKTINTLKEQLSLPDCVWNEERCAAMRFIARAYGELGKVDEQKRWLYRAIAEAPNLREPYVDMARVLYSAEDWIGTHFYVAEAVKIREKTYGYANEVYAWNSEPYDLAAFSAYKLGNKEKALYYSMMAVETEPSDERLINNHKIYSGL